MIRPRLRSGAKTAERVPTTTRASPWRTRHHSRARSTSLSAEWRTATPSKRAPNQARHWRPTHRVSATFGFEEGTDAGFLFVHVADGRLRRIDGFPGDDAVGLALAGDDGFAEFEEATALEASQGGEIERESSELRERNRTLLGEV